MSEVHMRRRYFVAILIALFIPGLAFAQETARQRAKALYEKGQAAYDAGNYVDAATAFEEANQVFPHPANLFNAAKAWERAAEYEKAIKAYEGYLQLYKEQNGKDAPETKDVLGTIEVLKEKAYMALPEVTIETEPSGADVAIDDPTKILGQTPFTTHIQPGEHTLFVQLEGYDPLKKVFEVKPHQPVKLGYTLEKALTAPVEITIESDPAGADVAIDDPSKVVGQTPTVVSLKAGTYKIFLNMKGFEPTTKEVVVRPKEPMKLNFSLSRESGGLAFNVNVAKARIYIDGKVVAITPYRDVVRVQAGAHQVVIEKERYTKFSETVTVEPNQTIEVKASLYLEKRPFSWRGTVGIISGVIGAAAIGVAAGYLRTKASDYYETESRYNFYKKLTYGLYGAGAGLLAISAGLLVWEFTRKVVESEEKVTSNVKPIFIPYDGVALGVGGRF